MNPVTPTIETQQINDLFSSIVNNKVNNKLIVGSIIGYDNIATDSIISDAIFNLYNILDKKKKDINDIMRNGKVNYSYWGMVLRNQSLLHKRGKKRKKIIKYVNIGLSFEGESLLEDLSIDINDVTFEPLYLSDKEPSEDMIYDTDSINNVKSIIKEYGSISKSNHFRSQVFTLYYFEKINISEINRQTGIGRTTLTRARRVMEEYIREHKLKMNNAYTI